MNPAWLSHCIQSLFYCSKRRSVNDYSEHTGSYAFVDLAIMGEFHSFILFLTNSGISFPILLCCSIGFLSLGRKRITRASKFEQETPIQTEMSECSSNLLMRAHHFTNITEHRELINSVQQSQSRGLPVSILRYFDRDRNKMTMFYFPFGTPLYTLNFS